MMKTKKILSTLLALCLLAGLLPLAAAPAAATWTGTGSGTAGDPYQISTWAELEAALNNGGYMILTADVTPENPFWADALVVPDGVTATLDLNGHVVDRGYTEQGFDGSVIKISGTLTLTDSAPTASHNGAVAYTDPVTGDSVEVTGGVITGGWPEQFGGGVQITGGAFHMQGGSIAGNSVGKNGFGAMEGLGGGVYLESGSFTMSGGAIVGNKAANSNPMAGGKQGRGGGVYVNSGTFTLTGGEITGNEAGKFGGGVYLASAYSNSDGKMNVSGGATVTGNALNGAANNVFLEEGGIITVTDTLTGTLGVTMQTPTPGSVFTSGLPGNGTAANFTSDDAAYAVALTDEGEAKLKALPTPAEANIRVETILSGRDWKEGDLFTFVLSDGGSLALQEVTVTKDTPSHTGEFDPIRFTEAGTYIYIVKENPGSIGGITYDAQEYVFTFELIEENGALVAASGTSLNRNATFTNTYAAAGTGEIKVKKVLEGRDWQDGDAFNFQITPQGDAPAPTNTTVTINKDTAEHTAGFGTINFTQPGTCTYTITETAGSLPNVTYDGGNHVVTIQVEDDGNGNLVAAAGSSLTPTVEITNTYVPPTGNLTVSNEVVSARPADANMAFTFTVTLSDTTVNGTFGDMEFADGVAQFTLKAGESRTAYGLPAGVDYDVSQREDDDFDLTGMTGCSGRIAADETAAAHFTNTRSVFTVTVVGGAADKATARAGETVTITANDAAAGCAFVRWTPTGEGVDYARTDTRSTTFPMPAKDVTVTAVYEVIALPSISDQTYTGEEIKPTINSIGVGDDQVSPDRYTLTYENNVNAGTATVTLTFKDRETGEPDARLGTQSTTFRIVPASIVTATIEVEDQTYTGAPLEPEPTVTWNGKALEKDTDYTAEYLNNVNVGSGAFIQITGKGNFDENTGLLRTFTITPAQEATPTAAFTATGPDCGTLSGLADGGHYTVSGAAAADFTLAGGTSYDLTDVSAGTLSVVKKGDGTNTLDSDAQTITVTKAAAPETVTADGCTTYLNNNGKLKDVTAAMEYKASDAESWTACTGDTVTDLASGTYLVRVAAAGTVLASDTQSVIVGAYDPPYYYDDPTPPTPAETRFDAVDPSKGGSMDNFKATHAYTEGMFADTDAEDWYAENIRAAVELGLMQGMGDGSYGVGKPLKCSEALAIVCRLHNRYYGGSGEFDQTKDAHWYDVYAGYAAKYGILADGALDLTKDITRAQFALLVAAALPENALKAITDKRPPDVAETDPAYPAIARLYAAGILNGVDEAGSFAPDAIISREQIAAIVTRIAAPTLRIKA